MQFCFSKKKFLSLELAAQHKKCCELIKYYCSTGLHTSDFHRIYAEWCSWMEIPLPQEIDSSFASLEERYHWHTLKSGRGVHEADFLISVITEDKTAPLAPYLGITTYLDGIRSAHNIGSILRTVEAVRLGPVVFSTDMVELDHPQIVKTSMSTWRHVELYHEKTNPSPPLPRPWIAIETVGSAQSWREAEYPSAPFTLFFGNEERGLQKALLQSCDLFIQIPLYGMKNSLNVANCHAIIAAEISNRLRH